MRIFLAVKTPTGSSITTVAAISIAFSKLRG